MAQNTIAWSFGCSGGGNFDAGENVNACNRMRPGSFLVHLKLSCLSGTAKSLKGM